MYCSISTYCIGLTLTKISILLQYRRIFTVMRTRIPIYVVMGITVAGGVEGLLTFSFMCRPVDAFWDVWKRLTATCLDQNACVFFFSLLRVF